MQLEDKEKDSPPLMHPHSMFSIRTSYASRINVTIPRSLEVTFPFTIIGFGCRRRRHCVSLMYFILSICVHISCDIIVILSFERHPPTQTYARICNLTKQVNAFWPNAYAIIPQH